MPKAQIEFSEQEILEMVMIEIQSRFDIEDEEEIEALAVVDRDEDGKDDD